MLIRSIALRGVAVYEESAILELPERGLVLISGRNGAGKSTWLEAVAAALWGETLRGAVPWRAGESGSIEVQTYDGLAVHRAQTRSGSRKLDWWRGEKAAARKRWESPAKAQAELVAATGSFEAWRRTSIFAASDADTFAAATNAPRVQLLERLLGLDRLGVGYERARQDRVTQDRRHAGVAGEVRQLQVRLDAARGSLAEARAALETPEAEGGGGAVLDLEALEAQAAALKRSAETYREQIRAVEAEARAADQQARQARDRATRASAAASEVQRRARALAAGACPACGASTCPTCGFDVLGARRAALNAEAAGATTAATTAAATAEEELRRAEGVVAESVATVEDLRDEQREIRDRATALEERVRGARDRAREVEREERARARRRTEAQAVLGRLEEQIATVEAELRAQEEQEGAVARELAVLEGVVAVLGPRGVRSQVLERGLTGLAVAANRLFGLAGWGVEVELRPWRTLADGSRREEIDLVVGGAGGGLGYRASSTGERRRLDIGLVLGLAELGAAAYGRPGTVWLDEVFDGLDGGGLDGVARILEELTARRAAVVVTHRPELAERLRPVRHFHAEAGTLQRVA